MTVKTHVAWYWRLLGLVVVLSCSFAVAAWVYDAGRRFAGFDSGEAKQTVSQLRERVARLTQESSALRASATRAKASCRSNVPSRPNWTQVKALEDENARLKEDLAFFDNLIPSVRQDNGLSINRFSVDPRRCLANIGTACCCCRAASAQPFQGSLQLLVSLQQDGKDVIITLPRSGGRQLTGSVSSIFSASRACSVWRETRR